MPVEIAVHPAHALSEMLALADDKTIVQHGQRLQRRHRDVARSRQLRGIGAIQSVHKGVGQRAKNKPIDTAPITGRTINVEFCIIHYWGDVDAGGEDKLHRRRTAHFEIKLAAEDQFKLRALAEIVLGKLAKRQISLKNVDKGEPDVSDIRNIGLAAAVELEPIPAKPGLRALKVFERGLEEGMLFRFTGDTIAMAPPFISTRAEIETMVEKLRVAIRAAR